VNGTSGDVWDIATSTGTISSTISIGTSTNPIGVAFTPSGANAYVVNKGSNNVSVITTGSSPSVTATVAVGTSPQVTGAFIASFCCT
jgi:YVTN family beta-propeller protein